METFQLYNIKLQDVRFQQRLQSERQLQNQCCKNKKNINFNLTIILTIIILILFTSSISAIHMV